MKLIGLSGYARAGKDTVADILVKQHGFEKIGFADALRDVLLRIDPMLGIYTDEEPYRLSDQLKRDESWRPYRGDYDPEVRRLLQQLGVAIRDVVDPDAWVNAAFRKMVPAGRYVIPDMRFPNEFYAIENEGGVTVRIERPGYGPVNGHISETSLDDFLFGHTLSNDGTVTKLERWCAALVAEMRDQR